MLQEVQKERGHTQVRNRINRKRMETTLAPTLELMPETQLVPVHQQVTDLVADGIEYAEVLDEEKYQKSFITANSQPITMERLASDCIIPVFAKDNEVCISHQSFISAVYDAVREFYSGETVDEPLIRVSHIIRGRIPEAIHKKTSELLPTDKTMYFERMAFCINIPSISQDVNGNTLNLSVVGVKSYGKDNLNGKLTSQRFSLAVSFNNQVCCNQCIFTDGYRDDIRAKREREIYYSTLSLLNMYDKAKQLYLLRDLGELSINEQQFALLLGRMRLYSYLPPAMQRGIPQLLITDSMVNNVAKQYYRDENFRAENNGEISLWKFYNLITGATKSSYIDSFLSRSANATETVLGIASALRHEESGYDWFLG